MIAAQLRLRGYDAVAVAERSDLRGSADRALWAVARAEGRLIVTQDINDFVRLARQDAVIARLHPGLILMHHRWFSRDGRSVGRLVESLRALLASNPADDALSGRSTWLEPTAG